MIDSLSYARTAQCRAKKKPARQGDRAQQRRVEHQIHAMVVRLGNPLAFLLTAGQAHDWSA